MCWVADAFRQSCSYGPLARGGGCNGAEPAYDLLDCWSGREDLSWKVLRGSGEGCKKNSIALEGRGGWLFDACGTANSVTAVAMYSSAMLVLCVARSDWKGGSQAGN